MSTTHAPPRTEPPPDVRAHRRRGRRWVRWRRRLSVAALCAYLVAAPVPLADTPPPVIVHVGGVTRLLVPGTTLAQVVVAERLQPVAGDFLDVEGHVIQPARYPGHLTVNGRPSGPARVLRSGDRVRVVHGRDRTEGTVREVFRLAGGRVANPQASLATAPGEQVTTRGRVSGKVVSSVFRPTGPYRAPLRVALTFDDGPSPTYTPKILDILDRMDVEATFFVVGTMVEAHPDLLRRAIRMGMTIGNHTYGHPVGRSFADRPRGEIRTEMERAQRLLRTYGIRPFLFRPPGGSWSSFVRSAALERGMRTVLWAVDSRDWAGTTADALVKRVLRDVRPGSIILLHDGGGDRSATVEALPRIIRGLRARGLEPVAIT